MRRMLLLVVCLSRLLAAQAQPAPIHLDAVRAQDFRLTALDGAEERLNDLLPAGHPVVIEFWATWCSPCRKTMAHLNQLAAKHAGLVVIGLNMEDPQQDAAKVKKFLARQPVAYPIAFAPRELFQVMNQRQDVALPKILVFDRSGRLVEHIRTYSFLTGRRISQAVEKALRQ